MGNQNSDSSSSECGSVTEWVHDLKKGDPQAAQQIFDRYLAQLIRVANHRLGKRRRGVADEEDVVSIAFAKFLQRVDKGGFSKLEDRNDLWQILFMLTDRKAIDLIRHQAAAARGADQLFGESIFETVDDSQPSAGISLFADRQPTPQYAAILVEECAARLSKLDSEQRIIAIDKMHGFSNQEIADTHDLKLRTVERRLQEIRKAWQPS